MSQPDKASLGQRIQKLLRISRAGKVALCISLSLLVITAASWLTYQLDTARVAWSDYMTPVRASLLIGLVALIGLLSYLAARVWFEETPARQSDLELAWQAGLRALESQGIQIGNRPLFVYLGCSHPTEQLRFFDTAGEKLLLPPTPPGASPIRWFISETSIRVFCSHAGVLGKTISRLQELGISQIASTQSPAAAAFPDMSTASSATLTGFEQSVASETAIPCKACDGHAPEACGEPKATSAVSPVQAADHQSSPGTQGSNSKTAVAMQPAQGQPTTVTSSVERLQRGLSQVEQLVQDELAGETMACLSTRHSPGMLCQPVDTISSIEAIECQELLEDFGHHLRAARRPVAAINGIGVIVDAYTSTQTLAAAVTCGRAIRADLDQLASVLRVHAPVTLVLNSAERLPGVSELIRRLGPQSTSQGLLGAACDPTTVCDVSTTGQIAKQALESIIHCTYETLRDPAVLTIPGNDRLVRLLMLCRNDMAQRLGTLVTEACAESGLTPTSESGRLLSGVFFVASGAGVAQRGFGLQVARRMLLQQQLLQWTDEEHWYRNLQTTLLRGLFVAAIMLALTLVVQLCWG